MPTKPLHTKFPSFSESDFSGLYTFYEHYFNILDKGVESITPLLNELSLALSDSSVDRLTVSNLELSYLRILVGGLIGEDTPESLKPFVQLFAVTKWLYVNDKKSLTDSSLYMRLSRSTRSSVVLESHADTNSKLRLVLRAIDSEPAFITTMLEKVRLLPSYRAVMVTLWGVFRTIKGSDAKRRISKVLKSEEMCAIIQSIFSKFCHVSIEDILNRRGMEVDHEGVITAITFLLLNMTDDNSEYIHDISVELRGKTGLSFEELHALNKDLRSQYKQLRIQKHQDDRLDNEATIYDQIAVVPTDNLEDLINSTTYSIDFGLSLQQKKELLSTAKFLLLKSEDVQIVPVMDNVRTESISTVAPEILKGDYDAIIILTKGIYHKEVFRVRSLCGGTPILFTSRTNRKLIIEDIYNQF